MVWLHIYISIEWFPLLFHVFELAPVKSLIFVCIVFLLCVVKIVAAGERSREAFLYVSGHVVYSLSFLINVTPALRWRISVCKVKGGMEVGSECGAQ